MMHKEPTIRAWKGADRPSLTLAAAVSIILWIAAGTKVLYLEDFWGVLDKVPLIPPAFLVPLSGVIISAELLLPIGLLFRAVRRESAIGLLALFGVFFAYSVYRAAVGDLGSCGCFHGVLDLSSLQDAVLDLALILICATILMRSRGRMEERTKSVDISKRRFGVSPETCVLGIAIAIAIAVVAWHAVSSQRNMRPVPLLGVRSRTILTGIASFEGVDRSPDTIVMFMDYQCGPCKQIHRKLDLILRSNPGKLRVGFRNFPIPQLHPYAFDAAVAVEAARLQGKYWAAHQAFLNADLSRVSVDSVLKSAGVDMGRYRRDRNNGARTAVLLDEKLATELGVSGTPTLFLCRPNGEVLRLRNSMDFESLL